MLREDGRRFDEERKIKITKDINIYAEGSVLIEVGNTKVICTASVTDKVPSFLRGTGKGWVTAEYSMLPRATNERNPRGGGRFLYAISAAHGLEHHHPQESGIDLGSSGH